MKDMAKNSELRFIFIALFALSIVSVCVYISNLSQVEKPGSTELMAVFQKLIVNITNNNKYLERKGHLQKMCKLYGYDKDQQKLSVWEHKTVLDHILVDERHKLLYCYVPKVACTNWKRIFMILTRKENTTDVLAIPANAAHRLGALNRLSNYTIDEIKEFLTTYKKLIFVRHPFERLLSAYRNKLEQHYYSSQYFQKRFGRHIIKNYRVNATNESLLMGHDVTFSEFTAYLIDPKNVGVYNEHWQPIYDLCNPCTIEYDIIGKFETLYTDAKYVLNLLGEGNIVFPQRNKPSTTTSHIHKYFSTLTRNTMMELYNIYKMDFKLFDYSVHNFLNMSVFKTV